MNEQASLNIQVLDALLLDYATGALSRPLELLVETHLAMNAHSAKTMGLLLQIGGVLLEDSEPVSLSEGALQRVMAEIEAEEISESSEAASKCHKRGQTDPILARPIADYVPSLDDSSQWRRVGIGIFEHAVQFADNQGQAKIYRIAPGTAIPQHTHTGAEVTLVLAGGFSDETGNYGPGDISIQESGGKHQPVADNDGECIVFAVEEGDIRMTGPIGRVLNLFVQ